MVKPGDVLKINAKLLSFKRGIAKGSAEGSVDGSLACKADFTVCLPDVLSDLNKRYSLITSALLEQHLSLIHI